MKITVIIKLVNRFKPTGIEDYKRISYKLPTNCRSIPQDHLNIWKKEIFVNENQLRQDINSEVSRIIKWANFELKDSPDFGDKLIGCIKIEEFDEFYYELFKYVGRND
ncbi:MAG: hypothetical protein Q8J97_02250 [Flavobacteriaceae bacterium]|nr:hypothetical protein [Flavobacteriaceae bacterium]